MIKTKYYKIIIISVLIALLFTLFRHYHLNDYLSIDGFNNYRHKILLFKDEHLVIFVTGYIISYILLIATCIPGTILFDLLAGFLFGPFIGTGLVVFSYLSGATLNFLLVKGLFRDYLTKRFGHLQHMLNKDGRMKSIALNLIGLRFIPVMPFWLLNILAAILNIPLKIFVITTLLGIIPTSVIYVMIGNNVRDLGNNGLNAATLSDPKLWLPLILLSLIIIMPNIIKIIKNRKQLISELEHEIE